MSPRSGRRDPGGHPARERRPDAPPRPSGLAGLPDPDPDPPRPSARSRLPRRALCDLPKSRVKGWATGLFRDRGPISRLGNRFAGLAGSGQPVCLGSFDFRERLLWSVAAGGAGEEVRNVCHIAEGVSGAGVEFRLPRRRSRLGHRLRRQSHLNGHARPRAVATLSPG